MQRVAKEEKVLNNVCTLGGKQRAWLLTEDGLYEVLMQSCSYIIKQLQYYKIKNPTAMGRKVVARF